MFPTPDAQKGRFSRCGEHQAYLQGLVVPLQLSAEPLQLAARQHGPAVLALQLVLLLHHLEQLLLQHLQLLLVAPVLLQLQKGDALTYFLAKSGVFFRFYFSALGGFCLFCPHSRCSFMQSDSPARRAS